MRLIVPLLAALAISGLPGCPRPPSDDDSSAGGQDDDSAGQDLLDLGGFAFDPGSQDHPWSALAGVTVRVTGGSGQAVSDQDGFYTITAPADSEVDLAATVGGHLPEMTLVDTSLQTEPGAGVVHPMVEADALDELSRFFFDTPHDPSKAEVWVGARPAREGMSVDLDAGYTGALAFGEGSPVPGNRFDEGVFQVGFYGVEPGPITLDVSASNCGGRRSLVAEPGTLYYTTVICFPPRAEQAGRPRR